MAVISVVVVEGLGAIEVSAIVAVVCGSEAVVGGSEAFVGGSEAFVGGSEAFVGGSEAVVAAMGAREKQEVATIEATEATASVNLSALA